MTEGQTPPPAAPGPMSSPGYAGPEPDKDAKTMAMLCHLLAIIAPFLGPLIIWLLKKDQSPFVDDQGKESLNFQITVLIAATVAGLTICIGIGLLLLPLVGLANVILCIVAGLQANKGVAYRYPFAIRLIK